MCNDRCLLIGYGNDLRGDDAVGRHVARAVSSWKLPHVEVLEPVQLTPELACDMAKVNQVIFVDADVSANQVSLEEVNHRITSTSMTHYCSPAQLHTLTKLLYGVAPQTFCLYLPIVSLELREDLSDKAQQSIKEALSLLKSVLSSYQEAI